jgi:hypothetical protein
MRLLLIAIGLGFGLLLTGCEPASQTLPTLVRFPTETATVPAVASLTAVPGNTLPPTFTPTFTLTATTVASTPLPGATETPTISITPSSTITVTSSPTPTDLPTIPPDERPLLSLALTALASTVLPTDFVVPPYTGPNITLAPTFSTLAPGMPSAIAPIGQAATPVSGGIPAPICTVLPAGGFGAVFNTNPDIAAQIGCPLSAAQNLPAASQTFEQGTMIWLNGEVLVLNHVSDTWQRFDDTFLQGVDPEISTETAPAGLFTPIRGFLKVWSSNPSVRTALGWGLTAEQGVTGVVQSFGAGRMIWLPGRADMLILLGATAGSWYSFAGSY